YIDPYSGGRKVFRELESVKLRYNIAFILFLVGLTALEIYKIQSDASTYEKFIAIIARKCNGRLTPSTFRIDDLTSVKILVFIPIVVVFIQSIALDVIYYTGGIGWPCFQKIQSVGIQSTSQGRPTFTDTSQAVAIIEYLVVKISQVVVGNTKTLGHPIFVGAVSGKNDPALRYRHLKIGGTYFSD